MSRADREREAIERIEANIKATTTKSPEGHWELGLSRVVSIAADVWEERIEWLEAQAVRWEAMYEGMKAERDSWEQDYETGEAAKYIERLEDQQIHERRVRAIHEAHIERIEAWMGEAEQLLRDAWGDLYLAAQGEGEPLKAIDRIRAFLGENFPPTVDDIYGSDPDFTGDQSTEEYVAKLRDREAPDAP